MKAVKRKKSNHRKTSGHRKSSWKHEWGRGQGKEILFSHVSATVPAILLFLSQAAFRPSGQFLTTLHLESPEDLTDNLRTSPHPEILMGSV